MDYEFNKQKEFEQLAELPKPKLTIANPNLILVGGELVDGTPCKIFVRYKPKFVKQDGFPEWHIQESAIFEFERLKNHIINKLDTEMIELLFCEVQLIKPKTSQKALADIWAKEINKNWDKLAAAL